MENLEGILNKFGGNVVKGARSNLTKQKKNVDRKLYNSLNYDVKIHKNSFGFYIEMEEYGAYQDQGVSGKIRKYSTPFSFKDKMPPLNPIFEWVKKRKLKFRNDKGQFSKGSQKSLAYIIRKSIYNNGIKPSRFFSGPFNSQFKKLPNELLEAYGLKVDKMMNNSNTK